MAQIDNIDAKRIEEAAQLATKLIASHTAEGRRFGFPLLEGELEKEQARDVERLPVTAFGTPMTGRRYFVAGCGKRMWRLPQAAVCSW